LVAQADELSGIWDWSHFSRDADGDERFEREEWHLVQEGRAVRGYYDRIVDLRSTDERIFRCNERLAFTRRTRVRVQGEWTARGLRLEEVGFEAQPGPCDDGQRSLVSYQGQVNSGHLLLRWSDRASQTLVKRPAGESLARSAASTVAPAPPAAPSHAVDGDWEWELRSIDADGEERVEREQWHLTEGPEGIRGYYDRTVRRSGEEASAATCAAPLRGESATRYTIVGQRAGDRLMLTEIDFKTERSECDNAQRRLDSYRGKLADDDTLILSWGPGQQLLRRKRAP
jgi:hypothetical protein